MAGCGTSEHAAMAITALLEDCPPPVPGRGHGSRSISRSTRPVAASCSASPTTAGPARRCSRCRRRRRPAPTTAAVTARPDSSIAGAADVTLVTPLVDRSWCHTVAFSSAILAGAAIAYADRGTAWSRAATTSVAAALASGAARTAGRRLHPAGRIVTAGMGDDLIAARELALKIEEGAQIPATAHHLETLLHGHLAGCAASDTRLVLVAGDRRLGERHHRRLILAARAVAEIGIPTTAIVVEELAAQLPDRVDVVPLPPAPDATLGRLHGLLQTAIAVQLLALGVIDAAGTNPDLIRRDQAPYRAAAAVGDESPDW